jgi:hypothetical protein
VKGVLFELFLRLTGRKQVLDRDVEYVDPSGWTLTARKGFLYDFFTFAPDLQQMNGQPSRACAVHDIGWVTGIKDDGSPLSFDENNKAFRAILDQEDHAKWIKDLYEWGVSLPFMRSKWRRAHGHE